MFAIAVYDLRRQRLLLTRDRFGIKPLFFSNLNERLAFASEIRALLQDPGIDRSPDAQAVHDYAALFYIPAPQTFYRGVRALMPGELLEAALDNGRVVTRLRRYHQWTVTPDFGMTEQRAVSTVEDLLQKAVEAQLESDVPLGTLLSGGIDSSLITAVAQGASHDRIRSFNVRFPDQEYDETWAAVKVASHVGSDHQTVNIESGAATWDAVTAVLKHAGQPYADTSLFAANAVCREMRKHVTVALSGDGGDEGFGGYDSFRRIEDIVRWQRLPSPARSGAAAGASALARAGVIPDTIPRRLRELSAADSASVFQTLFCWVRHQEHCELMLPGDYLPVRRHFEPVWDIQLPLDANTLERLSAHATEIQARLILPDDYLYKVDTASMKESLEVRVPMLDERLFQFGLTLPHELKVKEKSAKRVLRAVARKKLPLEVASKPKGGFVIPIDRWVGADFRDCLRESLLGTSSALPRFFEPRVYRPMVEAFVEGRPVAGISRNGLYQRAIMLLSLHLAAEV
jgi:asparagine synthase (glutamine-hydrolysing)